MADYAIPKNAAAYIFYGCLVSQADTKLFKSAPTLAAGDFKISIDGGAFANLATLPTNTPGTFSVKFSLSGSEMTGDNILVVASDAAGAEWCDQCWNIQTAPRGIADLAFPTTSGRSLDVTATGGAGIDWANVENPTTTLGLSGTTVGVLTTYTGNTPQTGDNYARIGAPAGASVSADVAAINAKTTNLPAAPASTTNITAGTITTATTVTGLTASDVAAIKAKTDSLTFTVPGQTDSNIQYVNDTLVTGNGSGGTPWGP